MTDVDALKRTLSKQIFTRGELAIADYTRLNEEVSAWLPKAATAPKQIYNAATRELEIVIPSGLPSEALHAELVARVVHAARTSWDHLERVKRQLALPQWPVTSELWDKIVAIDNHSKHQNPPIHAAAVKFDKVTVWNGTRDRQLAALSSEGVFAVRSHGGASIVTVAKIPEEYVGPDFAYGTPYTTELVFGGGMRGLDHGDPVLPFLGNVVMAHAELIGLLT